MVKQPTHEGYLSPVSSTYPNAGIKLLNRESRLPGVDSGVVFDELGIAARRRLGDRLSYSTLRSQIPRRSNCENVWKVKMCCRIPGGVEQRCLRFGWSSSRC